MNLSIIFQVRKCQKGRKWDDRVDVKLNGGDEKENELSFSGAVSNSIRNC